ncbi:hypothetical protein HYD_2290 [Candidatus Hydrogenosomobacter endosymbioticus]|uniref:Uncharacterized protein n=1 Tax=Candidatus Hydrogenosomobacter endosymbioticus TaxID=2558174 RepID=A0ABM7V9G1_9PROT|nr:hypothetical protein HYD_2290 [Candidatus Hydrogenosomobacter endosymbioticus]
MAMDAKAQKLQIIPSAVDKNTTLNMSGCTFAMLFNFIPRTGSTHGITFSIRPPKKAKNSIFMVEKKLLSLSGWFPLPIPFITQQSPQVELSDGIGEQAGITIVFSIGKQEFSEHASALNRILVFCSLFG